jgi:hypothetical protein
VTEIDLDDVLLTPAVYARWQAKCREFAQRLRDAGVKTTPGEEVAHVLPDGRLRISAETGDGNILMIYAEPREWTRLANN